ncbi:MAG: fibrobacter succinogenes major paralogous domain-containing protein [Dysgonamonadaceae bacterium]|jgi:uncharacterized protein (TIGR02145 family)|nr:fibrobacter succinogenes major paralogous domain-containing protein [Dysgonamonadaceae bacterium]
MQTNVKKQIRILKKKMKKVLFLMILPFLILGTASVNGQVRIGGESEPNKAAVLDLNETDTSNGTLGLVLPRVALSDLNTSLVGGTPEGMLVYNTNGGIGYGEGVYIWKGKWVPLLVSHCDEAPTISSPATDETKITKMGVELASALSVTADGKDDVPTYRWEYSATGTDGWRSIDGAKKSAFTAPVDVAGTTYYRCVVANGCGQVTSKVFTVIACPTAVQDPEGNWYCTGNFGEAGEWMTQNLRSTSGLTVWSGTNNNDKYYNYPEGKEATFKAHAEYGLLYTWAAASGRTDVSGGDEGNDPNQIRYQGICPDGWHLPSDYEWNLLEKVIAEDGSTYSTSEAAKWDASYEAKTGGRGAHGWKMILKVNVTEWSPVATLGTSKLAHEGGFAGWLVTYNSLGYGALYWTSSATNKGFYSRTLEKTTQVDRSIASTGQYRSVRCKLD